MINRRTINKALRSKGYSDEIFAGKGYWYFAGDTVAKFRQSSVCVYRLNDLTLEQWIEAYENLIGAE